MIFDPEQVIVDLQTSIKERFQDAFISYQTRLEELTRENLGLEKQVETLKEEIADAHVASEMNVRNLFGKFPSTNIEALIKLLGLSPDVSIEDGMHTTPVWFNLLIRYWKHRETLLHLFDFLNVDYPEWAKDIIPPQAYPKEAVVKFIENIECQYVCNGQMFSKNLGFWFDSHPWTRGPSAKARDNGTLAQKDKFCDPVYAVSVGRGRASGVELPWQLLFKSPAFQEKEVQNAVINCIKKSKQNSSEFLSLPDYQEFSNSFINRLAKAIPDTSLERRVKFIKSYIAQITDEDLITWFVSRCNDYDIRSCASKTFHVHYVKRIANYSQRVAFIDSSKVFSLEEKQALAKEALDDFYGDAALAMRVLGDEDD
jgi:hypothetical protein